MSPSRRVRDHMTVSPVTVNSGMALNEAFDLMIKHAVREVPVVDKGQLVAIVTDRDLREISPAYPVFRDQDSIRQYMRTLKVADAMTPDPLTVSPEASLVKAAELLVTYKISSVPVVENNQLIGMLSVTNFLELFIEQNQSPEDV